jgi:hypothetical protein
MNLRFLVLSIVVVSVAVAGNNPKVLTAVRTAVAPKIDGRMIESEWLTAAPISDFTQHDPVTGVSPTERTEVRVLYDDEALYFGCTMYDSNPNAIVARLARRDDEIEADVISLRLDTFHDQQTNYEFTVNAAGVKIDILQFNDGQNEDNSWDVVWDVETIVTESGWVAEIKIPFRALRFPERSEQDWGFQVIRRITRKQEYIEWAFIRKNESGWTSRFGHLRGIKNVPAPAHVEVLPYGVSSARFAPAGPSIPSGREWNFNGGLDVKFQPSASVTIDATFNPDFGQVEADPAVLNLSTFETFYPEKRPFFVEGSQIFQFNTFGGGSGLFYSRRIGRPVDVDAPKGGSIAREPHVATILGAAKISGKTEGGLSFGVLDAVTSSESARFRDSLGREEDHEVEPLANYSLIRLRQDVLDNSNVGMILTSVQRDGKAPAFTGGTDFALRFFDNAYAIDGFLAGTRSSSNGELRDGSAGRVAVSKMDGDHWRWNVSGDFTSRKYYVNDMGFFRRPNDYGIMPELRYLEVVPSSWYLNWEIGLAYHLRRNFDGAELNNSLKFVADVDFANYWETALQIEYDRGKYDDRESRGNGLFRKAEERKIQIGLESDPRESVVGRLELAGSKDTRNGSSVVFITNLELRPTSNLTLDVNLEHLRQFRQWAWIGMAEDLSIASIPLSIFGERTTREWNLTTRGSFVFKRDLTLQVYVQLFSAEGSYGSAARITGPDSFIPYPYVRNNFDELKLNSNVVLRWEYLPGSTMYFVWSQHRSGELERFGVPVGENLKELFGMPLENVFLFKMNYWLSF